MVGYSTRNETAMMYCEPHGNWFEEGESCTECEGGWLDADDPEQAENIPASAFDDLSNSEIDNIIEAVEESYPNA